MLQFSYIHYTYSYISFHICYARLTLLDLRRLAPLLLDETPPVVVGDEEEDDDEEDDEDDDDEEDDEEGALSSTTIGLSTVPLLPLEKERGGGPKALIVIIRNIKSLISLNGSLSSSLSSSL